MENIKFKNVRIKNRMCYYFDDIIKLEDFDFDKMLIDKKPHQYNISHKTFIGPKPLHIRFDKINEFIRIYDRNRYLILFRPVKIWCYLQ